MRYLFSKALIVLSALCAGVVFANTLAEHEATCAELGFKKRTPAYGECVLELHSRPSSNQSKRVEVRRNDEIAVRGDGSPDHQTCLGFGFVAGTPPYSDCRMKISIAKREAEQRQAAFDAEQAQYQERLAAFEKEKQRRQGMAMLQFGSALASGTSPYFSENLGNAGRATLGIAPAPPTRPQIQNFTITGPNGRMTNCNVIGNAVNCF